MLTPCVKPELSHPNEIFREKGLELEFASPKGGAAPVDPYSVESTKGEPETVAFYEASKPQWSNTSKIADMLGKSSDYVALFYPGGAGPMWDLATDADSQALIAEFVAAAKPVALVCHAPVALQGVKVEGKYLVEGRKVTGLSDAEEAIYDLEKYVPMSIEKRLQERGGIYSKAKEPLGEHVVVDGNIITAQNITSARSMGIAVVKALGL